MTESTHRSTPWRRRHMLWLLALFILPALLPAAVAQAQPSTPPVAPGTLSLEITCTPDTFRPDEWLAIECITHIKNNGENAVPAGSVDVMSDSGPIPEYFWISYFHSGRYWPVGTGDLSFPVPGLKPGETFESKVTELSRMAEGTWRGKASLSIDGQDVATVPLKETARNDAPAPSQDLHVKTTLANGDPDQLTPLPSAIFETVIANFGSSVVTSLTITERIDGVNLAEAQPKPSSRDDDVSLASWNLASFGLDSLGPGEALLLRTTYRPVDASQCSGVSMGVVVEATAADITERYGLRPSDSALLGDCNFEEGMSDGRGGPIAFGRGGEGPAEATFDIVWTAAFLAAAGAGLVATALLARRRLRP